MVPVDTMAGFSTFGGGFLDAPSLLCASVWLGRELECARDFSCDLLGMANASSANASVTRCERSLDLLEAVEAFASKENLVFESCSIENWSMEGNLADRSSSAWLPSLGGDFESSAANGSPPMTLKGEGLGRWVV
jgi:hypothetical protein